MSGNIENCMYLNARAPISCAYAGSSAVPGTTAVFELPYTRSRGWPTDSSWPAAAVSASEW